jgi:glucose/arabinose dehydrogenase
VNTTRPSFSRRRRPRLLAATVSPVALAAALLTLTACGRSTDANGTSASPGEQAGGLQLSVRVLATGLRVPWGLAFLPDGSALIGERDTGRILRLPRAGGRPRAVMRLSGVDTDAGEGGLLGLAVSPRYARDGLVYAYYTSSRDNRIVRFRLGGRVRAIVTGIARSTYHNGGRIAFGPDGMLYAGTGDAGLRANAQNRSSLSGKILRVRSNGSVPANNPFQRSRVYSLGHRNVQGLAWDRARRLWATEFGQNRLDEVNRIRRGRNYGWPEVEGRGGTHGGRYTNPVVTWPVSQASPSGAAVRGNALYVAALRGERLWRVPLLRRGVGTPRALLVSRYGRLRTIAAAPDGSLWVTTSNRDGRGDPHPHDDRILRLELE